MRFRVLYVAQNMVLKHLALFWTKFGVAEAETGDDNASNFISFLEALVAEIKAHNDPRYHALSESLKSIDPALYGALKDAVFCKLASSAECGIQTLLRVLLLLPQADFEEHHYDTILRLSKHVYIYSQS